MLRAAIAALVLTIGAAAHAQQPSWEDLALQCAQNEARDQIVANGIIAALQSEILQLKAQAQKAEKDKGEPR